MTLKTMIRNILKQHLDSFHTNCQDVKIMVKVPDVPPYKIEILVRKKFQTVYKFNVTISNETDATQMDHSMTKYYEFFKNDISTYTNFILSVVNQY